MTTIMRITSPCRVVLVFFLLLSLVGASARKLRGARTRRINQQEEELLFTEGARHRGPTMHEAARGAAMPHEARKGGSQKTNNDKESYEEEWKSGYGESYDEMAASHDNDTSGGKPKGAEAMHDQPAMKSSKEHQREQTKQGSSKTSDHKSGGTKMQDSKSQEMKYKEPEMQENSYDEVEGRPAPHEGSSPSSHKGGPASDESDYDGEIAYDEEYEDKYEDEQEDGKPEGKDEKEDSFPEDEDTPAPAPEQYPISDADDTQESESEFTQVQQMSQVAYVLSPFGLEYTIGKPTTRDQASEPVVIPTTMHFADVEAATISFLDEFIALKYNAEAMISFASSEIEATSRRRSGGTPFIDYEASIAFAEDSPITPTPQEIGSAISEAFKEPNLSAYTLNLAARLSEKNPFKDTVLVTVYVPDTKAEGQSGRVARPPPKMSAAGIAAAAGTGVLTLFVGGYLLLKIRNENMDIRGKFGKGYAGGRTLAGDTYDNCTLDATATLPNDDGQSLDQAYNNDQKFLSSLPPAALLQPVDDTNIPRIRTFDEAPKEVVSGIVGVDSTSPITDDGREMGEIEDRFQDEPGNCNGEGQDQDQERAGSFSTMVGRTRALVPTFKSSHMSNTDIKNYFKSKYKCGSPAGYAGVDEALASGVEASPSDDHSLNLVLPALDHDTGEAPQTATIAEGGNASEVPSQRQIYQDYEGAYMRAYECDQSMASSNPSDEGAREDHDNIGDGAGGLESSIHRLVATAQRSSQRSATIDPGVVPRTASEQRISNDHGETASVERHMDDISLGAL